RHGGTGLGLAISREIIEAMHGQIGLRSALGRGSTFWFSVTLPRIDARAQTLRPEAAPATVEAAPPRLLIVDDNAVNREVASSQLSRLGYRVYEAADGEAALEAWEMRPYAALLLDCEMPGMDGFAVAGRVRSLERLQGRPRTPIIAMTAHPFEEIRQRHREAGMDDHVPKPFTPEDLARTVARWVRASGASEKVKVNAGPESSAASLDVTLASAPTVDRSVIDDLIPPDSGDARGELIDLFLREAGGDCEALVAAASSGEWEKVASLAHRIKGSGRNMGAMALGNVAEAIERAAKAGSLKPSSTSVRRITAVFADTAAGFRELHPGGARRKKKA
ncbi:MAG: response regulator, partial [Myxococcales bacterium]|nr:response regulator [Myxococcales bacterium]